MWRHVVLSLLLTNLVQNVDSCSSFYSNVLFRTYVPRPNPTPPPQSKAQADTSGLTMENVIKLGFSAMATGPMMVVNVAQPVLTLLYNTVFPNEMNLPDITYRLPFFGSLHMGQGKIVGIKTYSKPAVKLTERSVGVVAEVKFTELIVTYDEITLKLLGKTLDRRAKGHFRFLSNNLRAEMKAESFITFAKNLPLFRCVFYIKAVKMTELGDVVVDIRDDRNKREALINAVVDVLIGNIEDRLADQLNLLMNTYLRDRLPKEKFSVCGDPDIQREIDALSSKTGVKPPSTNAGDQAPMSKIDGVADGQQAATMMSSVMSNLPSFGLGGGKPTQ